MKDYKVFTHEEFDERTKLWWRIMAQGEFPDVECVPIQHDIQKRRTRNFGMAHYKRCDKTKKFIPSKLSFSYRMLDGRYTLEFVDDVIKHEIGRMIDVLRHGRSSRHGARFKAIGREFDFDAQGSGGTSEVYINRRSSIYVEIVDKELEIKRLKEAARYEKMKSKINKMVTRSVL